MNSARRLVLLFAIITAFCILRTNGKECVNNRCPNAEKCYERSVVGQPDYVCECTRPFFMGYNCKSTSNTRIIETCYGEKCTTGNFSSTNYTTNGYDNRESALYLIYIPWATEILFSFGPTFQIERRADELYVGQGLTIQYRSLGHENIPRIQYFFDGFGPPDPFTIYNDTAWIYFISDKYSTFQGFQIFWNATVAAPTGHPTPLSTTEPAGPLSTTSITGPPTPLPTSAPAGPPPTASTGQPNPLLTIAHGGPLFMTARSDSYSPPKTAPTGSLPKTAPLDLPSTMQPDRGILDDPAVSTVSAAQQASYKFGLAITYSFYCFSCYYLDLPSL